MKPLLVFSVLLLAAFSCAQTKTTVPGLTFDPVTGELTEVQAIDRAVAFFELVGGAKVDRKKVQYSLSRVAGQSRREYDVNCGLQDLNMDSVTGEIEFYSLSSYAFRPSPQRAALVPPTPEQAEAIASAVAKAVGLPPNARRKLLTIRDHNPGPDADMRGYFSITYVGSDLSRLNLVFDRITGRLEFMMRLHKTKKPSPPISSPGSKVPLAGKTPLLR